MRGQAVLLLLAMTAVLMLAAGVALAEDFICSSNPCIGTHEDDSIQGTNAPNEIHALAGNDFVSTVGSGDLLYGGDGSDILNADGGSDRTLDGDDEVYGGPGVDDLRGLGGSDLLVGGGGKDYIDAREDAIAGEDIIAGLDAVKGGPGNDEVYGDDGVKDIIDCGRGQEDFASRDQGIDTVKNCEFR
jgi:Ca2+-binding RTX toxin-like protein